MSLSLQPVTKDNWQALIKLQVRKDQTQFVASNLYSIAQAQFGEEFEGHWDFHPFGIYDSEEPVGFLMYGSNYSHPSQQVFVIRLMVDEKYQGKGYGRSAMQTILEGFRSDKRIKGVGISYEPENDVARKLYVSLGFEETGRMIDGEVEAILQIRP